LHNWGGGNRIKSGPGLLKRVTAAKSANDEKEGTPNSQKKLVLTAGKSKEKKGSPCTKTASVGHCVQWLGGPKRKKGRQDFKVARKQLSTEAMEQRVAGWGGGKKKNVCRPGQGGKTCSPVTVQRGGKPRQRGNKVAYYPKKKVGEPSNGGGKLGGEDREAPTSPSGVQAKIVGVYGWCFNARG